MTTIISPEVKVAATEVLNSEGNVEISEVLSDRREETLALVNRLLASAGIEETFTPTEKKRPDAKEALDEGAQEKWFRDLKTRFDALTQLHEGIQWTDVEQSLKADPESKRRLMALDAKGHAMNVFGEENGEFIFASAWDRYQQVSPEHRNISFDKEGQKLAEEKGATPNGNAVSILASIMGVEEDEAANYLADTKFHEALRKAININGWTWLKTDEATRKSGLAFYGYLDGVYRDIAHFCDGLGSFRAALRVKKA